MIPWMRNRIAEAWYNRKSPRTAERQSLAPSSTSTGNSENNKSMNLTPLGQFFVKVISTNGFVYNVEVDMNTKIQTIKEIAVRYFHQMNQPITLYRLVHANKLKPLADCKTVQEEGINYQDELLLMSFNPYFKKLFLSEVNIKSPSAIDVQNATCNLPIKNPPKYIAPFGFDFHAETRKIILTLVSLSARLLMGSSEALNLFQTIKKKFQKSCLPTISERNIKAIIGFQFSREQAVAALYVKKNILSDAINCLIEHRYEPPEFFDMPVMLNLIAKKNSNEEDINSSEMIQISYWDACKDLFNDGNAKYVEENLLNIVTVLIEYFRYTRKLNFCVDREWIIRFKEMGFSERDIIEALKISANNAINACEWLLGNRDSSLIYMDVGLNPNDLIYQAILNDPQVQLSINNPKALLVYLNMLDVPMRSAEWSNDPEICPVFSQIFKTYHTEKHGLDFNRYAIE
ncbi:PREDICTED: ubiquitin-associated domain-containing protein 1 [Polistes dominula]|uniref:Ubiquitin-associated domain-containing protein 1 n=1 Tax=Polistes dominula TaxID=743375 RepID=A0ABM1ISH6_POLDO|nr:PREDICTED: ubiquitin-associated domain-containing protein 1 [Polistes dominula]XP_015183164.1 PREDICTED: ubiquitin-associated domain-containing protein 1 [Polistes dominula]